MIVGILLRQEGESDQAFILAEATDQYAGEGHFHGFLSMNFPSLSMNASRLHNLQYRAGQWAYSALSPLHFGMDKSEYCSRVHHPTE